MKQIEKEVVVTKTMYEAEDGSVFDEEATCKSYEHALNKQKEIDELFASYNMVDLTDEWFYFSDRDEEAQVLCRFNNKNDIILSARALKQARYCSEDIEQIINEIEGEMKRAKVSFPFKAIITTICGEAWVHIGNEDQVLENAHKLIEKIENF